MLFNPRALTLILLLCSLSLEAAQSVRTRLNAINLRSDLKLATAPADANDSSSRPFDEELLFIVHDTFLTGRYPEIVRLRDNLLQEYISTLAITLSYGQDFRRRDRDIKCIGLHAHRHEDALAELAAWFQFAVRRGARSIFLAGYGRGANQAALFAQTQSSPFLKGLILIDPLVDTEQRRLDEFVQQGQDLIQTRQEMARTLPSSTVNNVPFLQCPPHPETRVTAGALMSYYADNANLNTLSLLEDIEVRTLLVFQDDEPLQAPANDFVTARALTPDPELAGYEFNQLISEIIEFMDFY